MSKEDVEKCVKWAQLFTNNYYYGLKMKFDSIEIDGIRGVEYTRRGGNHAAFTIDPPFTRSLVEDTIKRQVNEVILLGSAHV